MNHLYLQSALNFLLSLKTAEVHLKTLLDHLRSLNNLQHPQQNLDHLYLTNLLTDLTNSMQFTLISNGKTLKQQEFSKALDHNLEGLTIKFYQNVGSSKLQRNSSSSGHSKGQKKDQNTSKVVDFHCDSQDFDERLLAQFYKRDENVILFHIYDIICQNAQNRELLYLEICSKYNEKYASTKKRCAQQSVKLSTLDIAHYCKKLEKIGFVITTTNATTSEKKISLRKRETLKHTKSLLVPDWNLILPSKPQNKPQDDEDLVKPSSTVKGGYKRKREEVDPVKLKNEDQNSPQQNVPDSTIQEMQDVCIKSQRLMNEIFHQPQHLTMREGIIRVLEGRIDPHVMIKEGLGCDLGGNLSSDEEGHSEAGGGCGGLDHQQQLSEDGKYTLSEISAAIGMHKEEKTMGRIMNELKKSNPQILSSAVRNGRIFQYKYFLKETLDRKSQLNKTPYLKKRESKEEEKRSHSIQDFDVPDLKPASLTKSSSSVIPIELNDRSYHQIDQLWRTTPERQAMSRNELIIDYFTELITYGKAPSAKRTLTIQTINRYIYCLNQVLQNGHISMVDIRNGIKNDLERGKGFEIDKKTLKRIVEKLAQDRLIKTVDFLVTLQQAEGQGTQNMVKTLVLDPELDESQADLLNNRTIANPTNRQSSTIKSEDLGRPSGYSLRSKRRNVNYRERSGSEVSSKSYSVESSIDRDYEMLEVINTSSSAVRPILLQDKRLQTKQVINKETPELIVGEIDQSKFQLVDESIVKFSHLALTVDRLQTKLKKSLLRSAFVTIFEHSVIKPEDNDYLKTIFMPKLAEKPSILAGLRLLSNLSLSKTSNTKPAHDPFTLSPFKLPSPTSSLLDEELNAFTAATLADFSLDQEDRHTPVKNQSVDIQLRLIEDTINQELIEKRGDQQQHVSAYFTGMASAKRFGMGQQVRVFENRESLKEATIKASRLLSRNGSMLLIGQLNKVFTTPYSLKAILKAMIETGLAKVEHEIEDEVLSRVVIRPLEGINKLYEQLKV